MILCINIIYLLHIIFYVTVYHLKVRILPRDKQIRNQGIEYIKNSMIQLTGLLIFGGKKRKISRDFQGQIRGKIRRFRGIFAGKKSKFADKSADFAGFSRKKSQNSQKNRLISAEKIQVSKDFQGQIIRKIGRFHGKFRGETSPRSNQ